MEDCHWLPLTFYVGQSSRRFSWFYQVLSHGFITWLCHMASVGFPLGFRWVSHGPCGLGSAATFSMESTAAKTTPIVYFTTVCRNGLICACPIGVIYFDHTLRDTLSHLSDLLNLLDFGFTCFTCFTNRVSQTVFHKPCFTKCQNRCRSVEHSVTLWGTLWEAAAVATHTLFDVS